MRNFSSASTPTRSSRPTRFHDWCRTSFNPKVGAIAGNAKVGNRVNLWTRWQALEYITSQNFERRALDVLGAVSVVPGAIGAWRVSAVREAGGYHIDTVAEDADLTMALLRRGYRVEYEDMALAYTEAPTNANGLMRQRFRWSFGILQAVYKHRKVFARKGALGWVALPNIVIFQILLPLVSPLIDIMFVVGTIWYYIQKHFHPDSTDPAGLPQAGVVLLCLPGDRLHRVGDCLRAGTPAPRRQGRRLAAQPGLAATLRLPAAIFDCAVQDPEARARRPQVRLGQTGAHGRRELCAGGEPGARQRARRRGRPRCDYRNSSPANSARFRRQTIQVCMPGVSMSVCWMPFVFSHSRRLRLIVIRRSSVPQAIHSRRNCWFAFASRRESLCQTSSGIPPELKAPTQANLSRLFRPVSSDSDPPIESPAIARELRSFVTRYSLSTFGMTSVSNASTKLREILVAHIRVVPRSPSQGE